MAADVLVWKSGFAKWKRVGDVPELFRQIERLPTAPRARQGAPHLQKRSALSLQKAEAKPETQKVGWGARAAEIVASLVRSRDNRKLSRDVTPNIVRQHQATPEQNALFERARQAIDG